MVPVHSAADVSGPLEPALQLRSVRSVLALLRAWMDRSRQRRALASLEAHRLNDIGKTRDEALAEADKPFWRA